MMKSLLKDLIIGTLLAFAICGCLLWGYVLFGG
jgi:hypothetical protein